MHRRSLLVAAVGVALAGPALTGTAGPAHADGPVLPKNARSTTVTVSPEKVKPGESVRVHVRCMTHVGGSAVLKVSSAAFPTVNAARQNLSFSPRLDPAIKPGTYTVRGACRAPGAYVKKRPATDTDTFTVVAPPAPPAQRKGPPLRKAQPRHGTQTRKVPAGAAATGFGEVLAGR
ncbi:hypothetical protein ACGFNU_21975 [Spirillospora sp. NPDC048911]|uniref:hypothetical protein n=1 Tax=Spirillospora sp. NPDC048911 TaxID=3364527 RepID=UPI0037124624